MSEGKIKKKYSGFEKKYSLPSFKKLDLDFQISSIENEKFVLREIRKKISHKIEHFTEIIGSLFEGEASISNIYEMKVLTDSKKEEVFKIFKELMKYSRQANILSLSYEEKQEADFIKEFYSKWEDLKEKIRKYLTLLKDSWDKESDINEDLQSYLG